MRDQRIQCNDGWSPWISHSDNGPDSNNISDNLIGDIIEVETANLGPLDSKITQIQLPSLLYMVIKRLLLADNRTNFANVCISKSTLVNSSACEPNQMKEIECRTVGSHVSSKESGCEVECSLERGLYCESIPGKPCVDFEIRVLCECNPPPTTPSSGNLASKYKSVFVPV